MPPLPTVIPVDQGHECVYVLHHSTTHNGDTGTYRQEAERDQQFSHNAAHNGC